MLKYMTLESESCSAVSNSLQPHGLYNPWNSPDQNTGVGSLSFLQGIFPTQGSNPGLLHCRQILYQLSHKGSTKILEWVAYPFSSGSAWPRNQTRVSGIASGFLTNWAKKEALIWPLRSLFFNFLFYIGVQSIDDVVIVSGGQQSHTHACIKVTFNPEIPWVIISDQEEQRSCHRQGELELSLKDQWDFNRMLRNISCRGYCLWKCMEAWRTEYRQLGWKITGPS